MVDFIKCCSIKISLKFLFICELAHKRLYQTVYFHVRTRPPYQCQSNVLLPLSSWYLSVCEVILAKFLPQQAVLRQGPQLRTHLAQADQVPAVRQPLHDVQLQTGRQVGQRHAYGCRLQEGETR